MSHSAHGDFQEAARADMRAERTRLLRSIGVRLALIGLVVTATVLRDAPDSFHLHAVTAVVLGMWAAEVSMAVPSLVGCLTVARLGPGTAEAASASARLRWATALAATAPWLAPFWVATGAWDRALGLMVGLLPVTLFASSALLGMAVHRWSHHAGHLALAWMEQARGSVDEHLRGPAS